MHRPALVESLEPRTLLAVISVADAAADEGANLNFDVTLDAAREADLTLRYVLLPRSGRLNRNFISPLTRTLTIPAGETTGTITIETRDDATDAPDKVMVLALLPSRGNTFSDRVAVGTIQDTDDPPVITIADASVTEPRGRLGIAVAVFRLAIIGATEFPITVDFATEDGTASSDDGDYIAAEDTVRFIRLPRPHAAVRVRVRHDSDTGSNTDFTLNISNATHASITDAQAQCTIIDRLPITTGGGGVVISMQDQAFSEADSDVEINIAVHLNHASSLPVFCHYQLVDDTAVSPSDYVGGAGGVTFESGTTLSYIHVTIPGDSVAEIDKHFKVMLDSPVFATLGTTEANISIADDDYFSFTSVSFANGGDPLTNETITYTVIVDAGLGDGFGSGTVEIFFVPQGTDLDSATPIKTLGLAPIQGGHSFSESNVLIPTGITPAPGTWQFAARLVNFAGVVFDEELGPTFDF